MVPELLELPSTIRSRFSDDGDEGHDDDDDDDDGAVAFDNGTCGTGFGFKILGLRDLGL